MMPPPGVTAGGGGRGVPTGGAPWRPRPPGRADARRCGGGWRRRFQLRDAESAVALAALAVELGGEPVRPAADPGRFALAAITAAFGAAAALPGWLALGVWRFACAVSGGRLIAASKGSPFLIVGR